MAAPRQQGGGGGYGGGGGGGGSDDGTTVFVKGFDVNFGSEDDVRMLRDVPARPSHSHEDAVELCCPWARCWCSVPQHTPRCLGRAAHPFRALLPRSLVQVRAALQEAFGDCGEVKNIRLPSDRESGSLKGFAYIEFATTEAKVGPGRAVMCKSFDAGARRACAYDAWADRPSVP